MFGFKANTVKFSRWYGFMVGGLKVEIVGDLGSYFGAAAFG
jgi:hypothetical protein